MIIGIVGSKRVGKNTVASIIQAIDIYRTHFKDLKLVDENTFIHNCLSYKYVQELKDKGYSSKYDNKAFADNLKMCISIITGVDYKDLLYNEEVKESDSGLGNTEIFTYRKLMQVFGTEVCQQIDKEIWVKSLFKDWSDNSNWIITDVRFRHEADYIVRKGGILFRINKGEPSNEHSSETGLKDYPSIAEDIMNNGSIDELIDKVRILMDYYKI